MAIKKLNDIEIIDNVLPLEYFNHLKDIIFLDNFNWFYMDQLSDKNDNAYYFFKHTIYEENRIKSDYYDLFEPIFKLIGINQLIRATVNLYPNVHKKVESTFHVDQHFPHKVAILYFNTTNGFTILNDGKEIDCIQNRLVKFDGSIYHKASFCTDDKRRIILNINYV